jgi:pimeloyl-ACP methyl ester carboxylesterase
MLKAIRVHEAEPGSSHEPRRKMLDLGISSMTNPNHSSLGPHGCVIALHCSLGSGRQWHRLGQELGPGYQLIAPDISGYGDNRISLDLPTTLAEEVAFLDSRIGRTVGPIHLVGHSYGGAIAFKLATASHFADRVRSLTLIEPVLPTLLKDNDADRRLHDRFARLARDICNDLALSMGMEATDKFMSYWKGSAPSEPLPAEVRLRMIERIEKIAFDFTAAFLEEDVHDAARALRVPTLLFSGGQSPYMTQRIVERLASAIAGAEWRHVPEAAHMLPITHAAIVNPEIAAHILRADDVSGLFPRETPPLTAAWR